MRTYIAIVLSLFLLGCAASSEDEHRTGVLECFGVCKLNIDRRNKSITTEPDGTVTEVLVTDGLVPESSMRWEDEDDDDE